MSGTGPAHTYEPEMFGPVALALNFYGDWELDCSLCPWGTDMLVKNGYDGYLGCENQDMVRSLAKQHSRDHDRPPLARTAPDDADPGKVPAGHTGPTTETRKPPMPEDPISQEMARILNEKLQRVIDKQTEHTIALANHTASLDRLEKSQEQMQATLTEILTLLRSRD